MFEVLSEIAVEFWNVLGEMSPYLLLGFFVAGLLSVLVKPETVERHLGGRGILPVFKAAIFGVPLPLCSCGVIPVTASLRRHGASRGAATSFLLSTPQTGVDSIFVTLSLLGPVFAVYRPVVALASGLLGGSLVSLLASGGEEKGEAGQCEEACCTGSLEQGKIVRVFRYGFVTLARDIAKPLILGLLVAGIISAVVPKDYFASVLGGGVLAMLVMMIVAIPVYVCATASVPVAVALIAAGVSPGVALVFLMTGPATNAAAIATIWKVMGRRTAITYLGTVAVSALAAGMLLDFIYTGSSTTVVQSMGWMLPGYVKAAAAFVLIAVVGTAFFSSSHTHKHSDSEPEKEGAQKLTLSVKGMTCSHCAQSVERALMGSAGVDTVDVNLKTGEVALTGDDMDTEQLHGAVEGLGFTVRKDS